MEYGIKNKEYTFIDLFAGAGGLSEGFVQAGFKPIAHVEMNAFAAKTLETRSGYYYLKSIGKLGIYYDYLKGNISREQFLTYIPENVVKTVMCETMSDSTLSKIFVSIDALLESRKTEKVDVIIGGPPCQAYSLVGRAQSSQMKTPMSEDPRNDLYKIYARFLKRYQPKMFVFENVMGIESANDGRTWKNIQKYLKRVGYEIECHEQNSKTFGVLQNRRRMIIVGWLKNSGLKYPTFEKVEVKAIVNDLFADLPKLYPGQDCDTYISSKMSQYVKQSKIRVKGDILTLHASRQNTERDINIYKRAIELWNDGHNRLNYNDLPDELKTHKNRNSFLDRYKVVEGDELCCHTMLAHISKDGHYFIHPDIEQHRSITVREAARIQSFPDNYFFEGPRTAQFVQIGNAVPPMMAKGIATGIADELRREENDGKQSSTRTV
jgi:DNA (cytosine-5)-methyltransferase 1